MSIVHTGMTYLLLVGLAYLWTLSRDKQKAQVAIKSGGRALLNILPLLLAIFALVRPQRIDWFFWRQKIMQQQFNNPF